MTTPKKKREAVLPPEVVSKLLEEAGDRVVLVGGQALAFWAAHFDVAWSINMAYVSKDMDFLSPSAADFSEVHRFAKILGGYAIFPSKHALTALIGQAVLEISEDEYFNVDVLHKVLTGTEGVRNRAVSMQFNGKPCKVMHPMDVLASRLINLYKLEEKQTELGVSQLVMAIDVMRSYLRMLNDEGGDVRAPVNFVSVLSKSDAGKNVVKRWGVHVADAIDASVAIHNQNFRDIQLPRLKPFMSEDYWDHVQSLINPRDIEGR